MNENLETLFKYIEPAKLLEWGFQAVQFFLVIIIALLILKGVKRGIQRIGSKMQSRTDDAGEKKRVDTLVRVFSYLANIVILLVGALIALGTIGISIGPILAAAGVVGLAVGFGSQSLVKDYFTGVVLLMENQIRAGDVIDLGSGRTGSVENVTLRYVRLRDKDGNVHFIPNGSISSVCNMTMDFGYALMEIGIAYKEDVEKAWKIMQQVGDDIAADEAYQAKILEPILIMGVHALADSAVIIRARYKTVAGEQWGIRREYHRRIKAAFDREGVEIPFPHMTVYRGDIIENNETKKLEA